MMRRIYMIILIAGILFSGSLWAQTAYYCVMEHDTIRVEEGMTINATVSRYIVNYGDQGYPFIEAVLDGYEKIDDTEYFHYRIAKGEMVYIDTVVFGDYSPREISLLSRYITLPESGKFHYTEIRNMIEKLKVNSLLTVEERADIHQNGIRFYTEAKQNIRFDAVVAYKQESDRQGIVGDISCELINIAGLGRLASFYWSRPTLGVNAIDISYTEPYILNKPFSVQGTFSQRFQDSLYVKRDLNLGLIYHINQRSYFRIEYMNERISTTSAGSDSGFVTQIRSGSNLSLKWVSPPKNVYGHVLVTSGINLASGKLISKSELSAQLSVRKSRFGVNLHVLGGLVASDDPVALYDQFKLGGANFLRGAYFEQYITDKFIGWKLEVGYFYQKSRLFLFYDGALLDHPVFSSHHMGIGFSLPAGNNRITIGIGVNLAESIQQAKFHLSWDMGGH